MCEFVVKLYFNLKKLKTATFIAKSLFTPSRHFFSIISPTHPMQLAFLFFKWVSGEGVVACSTLGFATASVAT